jgi:hypothetical protein
MKRLLLLLCGCQGALDQRLDLVDAPRVLAIAANPPEVKPGATTQVSALVVSPAGTIATQPAWSLCTAPKAPTEDNAVSTACTDGSGLTTTTDNVAVPADACQLFGPDVPPGGFRPRDPDPTGGYYQPVRADAADAGIAFGFARITCNLPSAPGDVAHDYQMSYAANQTPVLQPLVVPPPAANTDVTISTSWNEPETYLYYDPRSQTLVSRRESMRVSWFTSGGELAVDATQVGEDDPATGASTTWHVPGPGTYYLWAVLRDSRGGIAWTDQTVTVP